MTHYQFRKSGLMCSATYSARVMPWLNAYPRICVELQRVYEIAKRNAASVKA